MKIAITGGAGFIGSALTKLLKDQGHDVVLLDIKKSEVFPQSSRIVDITDKNTLVRALEGIEAVYHLAAEHRDDVRPVQKYYTVNVEGARNLVYAAQKNGINTIVFTSSVALYGLDGAESKESDPPAPFNDYGRSKREAEIVLEEWAGGGPGRKLVTIRLVATFGPGNRGNIHTLMDQIARGRFVMVGSGRNHKSIAYVKNAAAFLAHSLLLPAGFHLYNYADKPDLTTKTLVDDIRQELELKGHGPRIPYALGLAGGMFFDMAAKISNKNFPISAVRVRKFCADTVVSADKLEGTGFKCPYSLRQGLKAMIKSDFKLKKKHSG